MDAFDTDAGNFCPNCRMVIDDGMETISIEKTACEHRIIESNTYFGANEGEPYRFTIYTARPYLDEMLEDINRALVDDGVDPVINESIDDAMRKMLGMEDEPVSRRSRKNRRNKGKIENILDWGRRAIKATPKSHAPKYTEEEKAAIIEKEKRGVGAS